MRASRKGHYSCAFCRSRKLRCDRPLPCTNCATRGKDCRFGPDAGQQARTRLATNPARGGPACDPSVLLSTEARQENEADREDLLAEIWKLKRLAYDLEKRVAGSTNRSHEAELGPIPAPASIACLDPTPSLAPDDQGEVGKVVAHLERVSMGHGSHGIRHVDGPMPKIMEIRAIPNGPPYATENGRTVRVLYLPQLEDAKALLETFMSHISYIYHVVHHPSLSAFVDNLYRTIESQESVKPGNVILLLSIIASATLVWTPPNHMHAGEPLYASPEEATAQTPLWAKATLDLINGGENGPPPALETVQGIIILSFLICNLEGASLRYRLLISTGLMLGRELGLHRIDLEPNNLPTVTVEAEMGRRAWWYLVATDWLMSARFGNPGEAVHQTNPRQMAVNKPRNINDIDLILNPQEPETPLSQPTEMSYFLQRIRLAEISRSVADHYATVTSGPGGLSYYAHVMAMDTELEQMLHEIPAFFNLSTYDEASGLENSGIFIQAYLLNTIIHTQRCKLHLGYLTSRPDKASPTYAASWSACLKSARQICRAERQLERSGHPFAVIRQRLSGILYGAFMASVVLLMDACVNGSGLEGDKARKREASEALRVVDEARSFSYVAASLYSSLTQVLARYRVLEELPGGTRGTPSTDATAVDADAGQGCPESSAQTGQATGGSFPSMYGQAAASGESSLDSGQLGQLMDIDRFQWDDLFSGLDSSFL